MSGPSPTALTLRLLRRQGFVAVPVERWIPQAQRKVDLLRIADVLAVHARDRIILLVQATSIAHVGDRLKRCRARPELSVWLKAGGAFEVHGWTTKNGRPEVKRVAVRSEDLSPVVLQAPRRRKRRGKGERQALLFGAEGAGPG